MIRAISVLEGIALVGADASEHAGYSALLSRHRAALPPTHYLMVITKRYLQTEPAAGEPGQELAGLSLDQLQDKASRLG